MRLVKFQNKRKDREGLSDAQADAAFFTRSDSSKTSFTVEQKKERADRLAKLKKHSRCYKCGQRGHFGRECLESESSGESASPKRSRRNHRHKGKQKGKRSQANISASTIHADSSDSSSPSSEAFCTTSGQQDFVDEWFADSGATEHMTDNRQWFQSFQSIDNLTWSVSVADDHKLYIRGVGDIIVQAKVNDTITPLKLKNVLYVPKLRRNLISMSRLTEKRVAIIHI